MNFEEKKRNILKVLFEIAIICIFINPITLFFLTNSLIISLVIPLVLVLICIFLLKYHLVSRITIYFFNIVIIFGIFYHSELIFRTSFQEQNIPNLYEIRGKYYFNKPYLKEHFTDNEYISCYYTNKQGFRINKSSNPDIIIEKCDWLFLGDSFTQGAQVEYIDLFTTKTYKYFSDKVILNAGISGYSIVDAFNYFSSEGSKLKPSKVFLQLCVFNDFMNVKKNNIGITEYMMQHSSLFRYLFYNAYFSNPRDLPLGRWSEPFYTTEQENMDYNIFYKKESSIKKEDINNLIYYLTKFKKATSKINADLCIILIPTKEQISYKYYKEVVDRFRINETNLDMEYPNRMIDSLSKILNFELIDLYKPFRKSEIFPFFISDEHLNSKGHTIIAESILNKYKKHSHLYYYFTTGKDGDRYPSLFDNGKSILFQTSISECFQVAQSDTSFNSIQILTNTPYDKIHPSISNNKKWISYTIGNQENGKTKIILQRYNSNDIIYVTDNEFEYGAIPSFSPDNKYLAYASWSENNGELSNPVITLYNIKTKEKFIITSDLYESWRPIFHPKKSIIYYISKELNSNFSIVSLELNTKEKKIILHTNYDIWDPAISNDGNFIVFAGNKNKNWDLFLFDQKKKEIKQLTNTKGDEWDPSFGNNSDEIWFSGKFGTNNGIYRLVN